MNGIELFKTDKELHIQPDIRAYLIVTLALFESGKIIYDETMHTVPKGFNLSAVVQHHDKGVCACIFGWTTIAAGLTVDPGLPKVALGDVFRYFGAADQSLLSLFWGPPNRDWDLNCVTLEQAIAALRNYLMTGTPKWDNIITAEQRSKMVGGAA